MYEVNIPEVSVACHLILGNMQFVYLCLFFKFSLVNIFSGEKLDSGVNTRKLFRYIFRYSC